MVEEPRGGRRAAETYERMLRVLETRLSQARAEHSILVWRKARSLARAYGMDVKPGVLAWTCLMHDLAREEPPDVILELVRRSPYRDEVSSAGGPVRPLVWHGIASAVLASELVGVPSTEAFHAVAWHPVGHPWATRLLMLLMCADYLEEGRSFRNAALKPESFPDLPSLWREVFRARMVRAVHLGWHLTSFSVECYNRHVCRGSTDSPRP